MFFGFEILVGIFIGVLVATIVVVVIQIRTTSQISKLTFPAYEYAIKKAEAEADAIVIDARKKARGVMIEAEKAGQAMVGTYDTQANGIQKKYEAALARQTEKVVKEFHDGAAEQVQKLYTVTSTAERAITTEQKKVTDNVTRINASLEEVATKAEHRTQEVITALDKRLERVGIAIEASLKETQEGGAKKLQEHLASLQGVADEHLEVYAASRKRLLDAHIEQLVDAVVMKVLHTQLPVSTHGSLARDALKEAKSKHIL